MNDPINVIVAHLLIGEVKTPGEINDPTSIDNDEFDKGLKVSKYRYLILDVN